MKIDYIIVGQGLAGTLLAYFLEQSGKSVVFVDNGYKTAATKVAAGIFNPITGRRFVKSWMIDELFPFAKATYADLEQQLGISIFYPSNIVRALFNHVEENQWLLRSDLPENLPYVEEDSSYGNYQGKVTAPFSHFELKNAGRADIFSLVKAYRKIYKEKGQLLEENFDYQQIEFLEEKVRYKNIKADKIIFCEGYVACNNPYFSYLNYNPTKGEVLLVRIRNASFDKILKHKLYIVPFGDDLYWVGATNDWNEINDIPTEENRRYLENRLSSFLGMPFEIIEHQAAVRPTVKDRRPFLGTHPKHNNLAIFNGLGTKGASLGPYWAREMVDYLVEGKELDILVDIKRMEDGYNTNLNL
ncbi:MAG: glycine oxidase [Maribacter sp.]|jgi:glycine oxidase